MSFFACGQNGVGQLGLGHTDNQSSFQPVVLPEGKEAAAVAGSENHSFVIADDGTLFSCG